MSKNLDLVVNRAQKNGVKYLLTILCLREKTIKAVINKINNDGTPIDFFWVVKNKSNIDQLEEENKNERSSRSH